MAADGRQGLSQPRSETKVPQSLLLQRGDRDFDARLLLVVRKRDRHLPYLAIVLVRDAVALLFGD
jgi:hypothetical protein